MVAAASCCYKFCATSIGCVLSEALGEMGSLENGVSWASAPQIGGSLLHIYAWVLGWRPSRLKVHLRFRQYRVVPLHTIAHYFNFSNFLQP